MSLPWEPGLVVEARFRLVERIGRGAIGTVWRSDDLREGGTVALKLVELGAADGDDTRERRFTREARATLRLRSPHVVGLVDAGTFTRAGTRCGFLAMELLEGETLATRLGRERRLSPETTLDLFEQVGRAVSLAHSLGLVHRDLKPANIFLCGGVPITAKILDFGLAKSLAAPLVMEEATLTRVGDMIGTPLYMSPEQAQGSAAIDHRTDLWALGVLVFECLTGERPFEADTLGELLGQLEDEPILLPSSVADVPEGFDDWFARAVSRDVQMRFQSASALIAELGQVLAPDRTRRMAHHAIDPRAHTALFSDEGNARTARRMAEPDAELLGRGALLAAIDEAFASHARVITLCGARGVGRSAIARAHAAAHRDVYTGGTWTVNLGAASDGDALWRRLALGLGCLLDEDEPERHIALAASRLGRALLVLERVEQIREATAGVVSELLKAAPQLAVLVTSDQPLHVASERRIEVSGLAVSDDRAPASSAAHCLLVARAGAHGERGAADLVQAVDGNPLAIELAAGLGPRALDPLIERLRASTRIDDSDFRVKAVTEAALLALPPVVRAVLVQLSCFRGTIALSAAEIVVSIARWPASVAEVIGELTGRGWLTPVFGADGPRHAMHPIVRKVASRYLRAVGVTGEREPRQEVLSLIERHGELFARSGDADAVEALLRRGGAGVWRRALEDAEDVAAALERAKKRKAPAITARSAIALSVVESELGRHGTAARLLLAGMAAVPAGDALHVRCGTLRVSALSRCQRAQAAEQLATRLAEDVDGCAPELRTEVLLAMARAAHAGGDRSRALSTATAARRQASHARDRADADVVVASLVPENASACLVGAASVYRHLGEARCEASALEQLGAHHASEGRHGDAIAWLSRALAIHRRLGLRPLALRVLVARGKAWQESANRQEAERDAAEAAALAAELGAPNI